MLLKKLCPWRNTFKNLNGIFPKNSQAGRSERPRGRVNKVLTRRNMRGPHVLSCRAWGPSSVPHMGPHAYVVSHRLFEFMFGMVA